MTLRLYNCNPRNTCQSGTRRFAATYVLGHQPVRFISRQTWGKMIDMNIYGIDLPRGQRHEEFAMFMREVYLSAVHTPATRGGEITGLTLLETNPEDIDAGAEPVFFLHVEWHGVGTNRVVVDDATAQRFGAFHARITRTGEYTVLAT